LKIAITIEHFEPARGGGETYCRNFARMLLDRGHEVHIFAFSHDQSEKGFIFHRIPLPPGGVLRRYIFARRAEKLVRRHTFDIIHGFGKSVYMDVFRPGGGVHRAWMAHNLRAAGGALPRLALRLKQLASLDQRLVLHLEKTQFGPGRRHHIIAVSNLVRDEIIRYYRCEPHRIHVVHNGADLRRFTPDLRDRLRTSARRNLALADNEIAILFLGHNFKRKGLHALIRAMPLLKQTGARFRLIVAGKGRRKSCDRLAADLGVADRIQYLGAVSQPEPCYAAADIFCLPSYYDPCANVVLEALASALPVVTSPTNGAGEILTHGKEGYIVNPDDPDAMAACIAELFHSERRLTASRAARALAETRPIERNFNQILAVYETALAEKHSSR